MFVVIIVMSCEKESNNNIEIKNDFIIAGLVGENVKGNDSLHKTISISLISCLHYYAIDSIDCDFDSIPDTKIIIDHKSPDLVGECCTFVDSSSDCFGDHNGYRQVKLISKTPTFECVTSPTGIVNQFNHGDTISKKLHWNKQKEYFLDNYSYPNAFIGLWSDVTNKYIGYRYLNNDTIYGWLKISTSYNIVTIEGLAITNMKNP